MPIPIPLDDKTIPAWLRFMYAFGVTSAIAVFLVYVLVTKIEVKLDAVVEDVKLYKIDNSYVVKNGQEQLQKLNVLILLMQKQCVRQSRTDEQRDDCFSETAKSR